MNEVPSESGLALLARLETRPSLDMLDPYLFPGGPQPGEIIELTGNTNCSKSSLCLRLIVTVLLPQTWRGINMGGCDGGVIFLDSDLHFSILQLENMMQRRIKNFLKMAKDTINRKNCSYDFDEKLINDDNKIKELLHSDKANLNTEIDRLIKQCLKSFFYLKCTDSAQFAITLLSMNELIMNKNSVSLIVVDSISAFYWYDRTYRADSWYKLELYYNKIFKVFLGHIKNYKLVLLSTRQSLFQRDFQNKYVHQTEEEEESEECMTEYEYMGREWANFVTCRIHMSKLPSGDKSLSLDDQSSKTKLGSSMSVKSSNSMTVDNITNNSESSVKPVDYRQIYSAEVIKNGKKSRLIFTVHEDGLRWRPQS